MSARAWRVGLVLGVALVAVLVFATRGGSGLDDPRLIGDWRLVDGIQLVERRTATLRITDDAAFGRVCNNFNFDRRRGGGFSMAGSTEASCGEAVDAQEQAFQDAVVEAHTAQFSKGRLVLIGPRSRLTFEPRLPLSSTGVLEVIWELAMITDDDLMTTPAAYSWLVLGSDGRIEAWTGCRQLEGTFTIRGPDLVTPTLLARGACPAELAGQNEAVLGVTDATEIALDRERLVLTPSGGRTLVYEQSLSDRIVRGDATWETEATPIVNDPQQLVDAVAWGETRAEDGTRAEQTETGVRIVLDNSTCEPPVTVSVELDDGVLRLVLWIYPNLRDSRDAEQCGDLLMGWALDLDIPADFDSIGFESVDFR